MNSQLYYWLDAIAPGHQFTRMHRQDAGYDIAAAESASIPAGGQTLVHTGLHVAIPDGYVGLVKSRSGNAVRHRIEAGAGVIDSNYRGEVGVLLRNHNPDMDIQVNAGDRIAQMCIVKLFDGEAERVPGIDMLGATDRGSAGYGSTGA